MIRLSAVDRNDSVYVIARWTDLVVVGVGVVVGVHQIPVLGDCTEFVAKTESMAKLMCHSLYGVAEA